ncbi:putative SLC9B1-like protein SLC9B1P1 isoform X2 [Phlebotomus argentipes]|uniref:putative SLC9B1-like protein SLC9B1P1 isoform X2 n=1 Tax=Phlebotomus argentipes TaxID=94469 RepID=UPI002892AF4A|nr:putative SLC9B1-like protein SLC9B1P1 isoform X2 [Phlebotomus argentipes]
MFFRRKVAISPPEAGNRVANPSGQQIPSIDLNMSGQPRDEEAQKVNLFHQREPENEEFDDDKPKIWNKTVKHWPVISQPLSLLVIFLLMWGVGYSVVPQYTSPDSPFMRMVFLFIGGQTCGILVSFVGLPDMLGMIGWGVFYRNIGLGTFVGLQGLEAILRELALVNIMLLAGLGLDLDALRKLFGMVMKITLIPTAAETVIVAVLAVFLFQMPWLWGFLLGLVVTAVSPNVVISILLQLKEQRLGLNKGIHTLIIAMTSCNDVIAIFCFGVVLGVIFSSGNLTDQLLQGPIGIVLGLVAGFGMGVFLTLMPSNKSTYSTGLRVATIVLAGVLGVVGSKAIGYPSAGALSCIVVSFVAGTGWRKKHAREAADVTTYLDLMWKFMKPISFSMIGKEVAFNLLEGETVLYGFVVLIVGVLVRVVFAYASLLGGKLNWKEKAYVTISSCPKATVQAALGPVALDLARKMDSSGETLAFANQVLIVSVLAITATAPLGALLMTKLAPSWLKRSPPATMDANGATADRF